MKNEKGKERYGREEGEEDLASESDDDGSDDGCDRAMCLDGCHSGRGHWQPVTVR